MDDKTCCWGCGQKRPDDAPGGLCPACLIRAGHEGTGKHTHEVTVSFGPAFSSTFSRLPESLGGLPQVLLRDTDPSSDSGPIVRPASEEMPDVADRTMRLQLFGEIARGGMEIVLKARDLTPKGVATAIAKLEASDVLISNELHALNHWR
jgi:hypothetical protein